MMTRFDKFINEQHTLTIEDSMDDFETQETVWLVEIDVSDIWNKYNENKNISEFIGNYVRALIAKKSELVKISNQCWNDLVKLVKKKPGENKMAYLDDVYDWADKYGVKIITKNGE